MNVSDLEPRRHKPPDPRERWARAVEILLAAAEPDHDDEPHPEGEAGPTRAGEAG